MSYVLCKILIDDKNTEFFSEKTTKDNTKPGSSSRCRRWEAPFRCIGQSELQSLVEDLAQHSTH